MAKHLQDSGPLPAQALKALSYINEKDTQIEEIEKILDARIAYWERELQRTDDYYEVEAVLTELRSLKKEVFGA